MYNGSSNWFDIDGQLDRQTEFLREAGNERLARSPQKRRKPAPALRLAMLDWLGGRLVCWGSRLQERAGGQPAVSLDKICC